MLHPKNIAATVIPSLESLISLSLMRALFVGLLIFFVVGGCVGNKLEGTNMTNEFYSLPEDCDFSKVKNNSSQENDCSPKLKDKYFSSFKGIAINLPKTIVWTKDLRLEDYLLTPKGDRRGPLKIMLSGILKIPYGTLGVDKDFKYQILIVAIDQTTSEIYQGKMNRFGERTPAIKIPGYEETRKGLDSQENFNVDLVHNLDLPIAAAKYTVYAVFGDYKSNVLEVDVDIR